MSGRPWTHKEIAFLRSNYGSMTAAAIAERLGRSSPATVHAKAKHLKLADRHRKTAAYAEQIRKYHARGWLDGDIARKLAVCRETVTYHRRRLGLPANRNNDRHRARVQRGVRKQCHDSGAASLVELRWQAHRLAAFYRGWPGATTPRQCDVLDLLHEHGPMTKRQIQDSLGLVLDGTGPARYQRPWVNELLRSLRREGLVVSLGRKFKPGGSGRSQCLYRLADGVRKAARGPQPCNSTSQPSI
jgi:hypothetical protein